MPQPDQVHASATSGGAPRPLAGAKVLVMGLGRFGGGVGVARWLVQQGDFVTVTDSAPPDQLAESVQALHGLPITFKLGGHAAADFLSADLIVVNPAVDRRHSPELQAALQKGIPATTEMNLFVERCPATTVGITGSVGKSTTTALVHQALLAALDIQPTDGESRITNHGPPRTPRVFLGGNIGRSLLLELHTMRPNDFVVLELSSFMLEETPAVRWSPHVCVVTNVFPNHLDRHGTMADYTAAKQNILRFQSPHDIAILNADHEVVGHWGPLARGKVVTFTSRATHHASAPAAPPASPADSHRLPPLLIPGVHNESNAAAAVAVLDALASYHRASPHPRFDRRAALRAIAGFPGLPHRLQLVHTMNPGGAGAALRTIRFYNDSKATSPDASITALLAFPPHTAIFIVGGYDKHIDLSPFEELLAHRAAGVIGIGATGPAIVAQVRERASAAGAALPRAEVAGTLEGAIRLAQRWVAEDAAGTFAGAGGGAGGVEAVVLSPASASWDQFPNYEVRGERFIELSRQSSSLTT